LIWLVYEGFWAKSEGKGVAFGGFPSKFFDFFGEFLVGYQFPLYLYLTYEVFSW
jgi:hypothetical protein